MLVHCPRGAVATGCTAVPVLPLPCTAPCDKATAAANHVASFCREVKVVTCLGEQDSYEDLIRESMKPNVDVEFLFRSGAPTTRARASSCSVFK